MTALLFARTALDWQSLPCQLLKDFSEVAQAYPVWNCKLPSKQFGLQIVKNSKPKPDKTKKAPKHPKPKSSQTHLLKYKIQNMVLQMIHAFELELPCEIREQDGVTQGFCQECVLTGWRNIPKSSPVLPELLVVGAELWELLCLSRFMNLVPFKPLHLSWPRKRVTQGFSLQWGPRPCWAAVAGGEWGSHTPLGSWGSGAAMGLGLLQEGWVPFSWECQDLLLTSRPEPSTALRGRIQKRTVILKTLSDSLCETKENVNV